MVSGLQQYVIIFYITYLGISNTHSKQTNNVLTGKALYLTCSSEEKLTGFTDPTFFPTSGKGTWKKIKKPICFSPYAGFDCVLEFQNSLSFSSYSSFKFVLAVIFKIKLGTNFEKQIFQLAQLRFPL